MLQESLVRPHAFRPEPRAQAPREEVEERRIHFERALMDADRMMMQVVQTSLSLIAFGFTINTFFNDVANRIGAPGGSLAARILGLALLLVGLLLLTLGASGQWRYRRELRRRHTALTFDAAAWRGLYGGLTPSYLAAVLLMVVGLGALAWVVLRSLV